MPTNPRIDIAGLHYHIIARGNNRERLFQGDSDYRTYLNLLIFSCSSHQIDPLAYCLMPNHVHLLLHANRPNLSKMMERLQGVYARSFNRKHPHYGHVFQGRFMSKAVLNDAYLQVVGRYIHMNPVNSELADDPADWPWSSFKGLLERRLDSWHAHPLLAPHCLGDRRGSFHSFTLLRSKHGQGTPAWPCPDDWYRSESTPSSDDRPAPQREDSTEAMVEGSIRRAFAIFRQCDKEPPSLFHGSSDAKPSTDAKWAALWLLRNDTTLKLEEIAHRLGYRSAQVAGNILMKVKERLARDAAFRERLSRCAGTNTTDQVKVK